MELVWRAYKTCTDLMMGRFATAWAVLSICQTKKKLSFSIAAASKQRNIKTLPISQYRNTSFRYEGWICIRLVICWGVFNSVLLLSLKQLNLLMLFDIFYSVWFFVFFCVFFKIRRILNKASPLFGFFLSLNRVDFEYVTEAAILPHKHTLIRPKSCKKIVRIRK